MKRDFARIILKNIGIPAQSSPAYEEQVELLVRFMDDRCSTPLYPNPGESLAISVMSPKTAALAFDKIYRIPVINTDPVPETLGFYCATPAEMAWWAGSVTLSAAHEVGIDVGLNDVANEKSVQNEQKTLRWLCSEIYNKIGVAPTIFYHAVGKCKNDFPSGKHTILMAAISNIAMVDEESLNWDQIMEFRKDTETRIKYRRFVRWVDTELKQQTKEEIEDLIAIRLDDYQWALKKHGIKTSLGTLSCLLDPKFLGTLSAAVAASAVAGGGFWAATAGAGLAVGKAVVNFGTSLVDALDERRKNNSEVAYIYDVQKKLG